MGQKGSRAAPSKAKQTTSAGAAGTDVTGKCHAQF